MAIGMGGLLIAIQRRDCQQAPPMRWTRLRKHKPTSQRHRSGAAQAQARATEEQANANRHTERRTATGTLLKNAIAVTWGDESSDSGTSRRGITNSSIWRKTLKNLRRTVFDILCAHIRQTTRENEYREKHRSKPSEEIQSLLTLLFVQRHAVFKGVSPINLRGKHG